MIFNLIKNKLNRKEIGQSAELIAKNFLEKQGLKFIEAQFRCRLGEIDLVMRDINDLVFIEVRYRQNQAFGSAIDSIDFIKQQKIQKTALFYLHQRQLFEKIACRFDIIAIHGELSSPTIEWLPQAFET